MNEIISTQKVCWQCNTLKSLENFYKNSKNGMYLSQCKICKCKKSKQYRKNNFQKIKIREQIYQQINRKKIKIRKKRYYLKNTKIINQRSSKYQNNRLKIDPIFRLTKSLRSRIYKAINGITKKSVTTESLLGCNFEQAKIHIESQFQSGMSWDNYGDWHIDHRLPCASFDLSNPDEQKVCFHYTNLQPLWATTEIARQNGDMESIGNLNKGDSLEVRV